MSRQRCCEINENNYEKIKNAPASINIDIIKLNNIIQF